MRPLPGTLLLAAALAISAPAQIFRVTLPASPRPLDGRLMLLLSNDPAQEPRMQINDSPTT